MTCFLIKDINKEYTKEDDMMLLVSDKETKLEQLEEIIEFKKQVFAGSEECCYLIDIHDELVANLFKRPFVFDIVAGYELNKIRNFGIAENQKLMDKLRGKKVEETKSFKSSCFIIKDESNFYEYGLFDPHNMGCEGIIVSNANNRTDAIRDLVDLWKNAFGKEPFTNLASSIDKGKIPFLLFNKEDVDLGRFKYLNLKIGNSDLLKNIIEVQSKKKDEKQTKSIPENCSRCGRANTWHPDCPTCKRIYDLEQFVIKLSYFVLCVEGRSKRIDEIVLRHTLEALNITEDDLINKHNKIYHKLVNSIIGRE